MKKALTIATPFLLFLLVVGFVIFRAVNTPFRDQVLLTALSEPSVSLFVDTYGKCDGCSFPTPVEYEMQHYCSDCVACGVKDVSAGWDVEFWIGERCSFRYNAPSEKITVHVDKEENASNTLFVSSVHPTSAFLNDATYCEQDRDCQCLSGSGVPFVGCQNSVHASMFQTGAGQCSLCGCVKNQCTERK
ncbi:MAG: hypothetical protein WCP97_04665 [bacterium]